MTLQEWADGIGMHGITVHSKGDARWIPDSGRDVFIEHARTQLFNLEDYFVSSISSGTIWLLPRATAGEYRRNEWVNRHTL